MTAPPPAFERQNWWRRARTRLFHLAFLVKRPMTFGVRAVVHDREANAVFLIRHTYVAGWQFPGGGVETGETALEALGRELFEEANIEIEAPPVLRSLHLNRQASRRDHVAVYLVETYRQRGPKQPDFEIAEAGFFPLDALPAATTSGTRRRLAEIFGGEPPSAEW